MFEIDWLFCFCCLFVPKINIQIGTEQELEKIDRKSFGMAPPAKWVMVYSSGTLIISCSRWKIADAGKPETSQKSILGKYRASKA